MSLIYLEREVALIVGNMRLGAWTNKKIRLECNQDAKRILVNKKRTKKHLALR